MTINTTTLLRFGCNKIQMPRPMTHRKAPMIQRISRGWFWVLSK